jgi:hypothetical protein
MNDSLYDPPVWKKFPELLRPEISELSGNRSRGVCIISSDILSD